MGERPKEERSFAADEDEKAAAELRAGIERLKSSLRNYRPRVDRKRDDENGRDGHPS